MKLVKRRKLELQTLADIEAAAAGAKENAVNVDDIMTALVELGDMIAAQDDAIVELADLIGE